VAKHISNHNFTPNDANVQPKATYHNTDGKSSPESSRIRAYTINKQLICGDCGVHVPRNTIHQLTLHARKEHPYTKPTSCFGAGRNEWDDHFKGCASCLQWFHIDENHPMTCDITPVNFDELDDEPARGNTTSSSSEKASCFSEVAISSVESNDPDFSFLSEEERKRIETKSLKCSQCHTNIKANRITNLVSHYFYAHGNIKPAGYGIDNIGEFVICNECHRWVAELDLPTHKNECALATRTVKNHWNPNVCHEISSGPSIKRILPTEDEVTALRELLTTQANKKSTRPKNLLVNLESIKRLAPGKWLNDEVINSFI
jgi:hypothetical protein